MARAGDRTFVVEPDGLRVATRLTLAIVFFCIVLIVVIAKFRYGVANYDPTQLIGDVSASNRVYMLQLPTVNRDFAKINVPVH